MSKNTARIAIREALLIGLALCGAGHTPALAVESHAPSAHADVTPDTIHGIVFDSLLHKPIGGATVLGSPGGASTTTDDDGRFTILSAGRVRRIAVFHDLLDRTGIGSLSAVIDSTTTRRTLVLSTPSIATIWLRLCSGLKSNGERNGIVFGTARKSDGSTRVSGARIRVSWDVSEAGQNAELPRVVETRSDSIGGFYACGVPPQSNVYVIGLSSQLSSGAIIVRGDSVPLRKQDVVVGETDHSAAINGIVEDEHRLPVPLATVDIDGVEGSTKTDETGHFRLTSVPTGSRTMLVRAVGYEPVMQPIEVLDQSGVEIRVSMQRMVMLPGVKVRTKAMTSMVRDEFEQRRKIRLGTIIDSLAIKPLYNMRSIFQGVTGLTTTGNPPEFTLYMTTTTGAAGGMYHPTIYLDGFKTDEKVLAAFSKNRVAAVELYMRATIVPAKYEVVGSSCGAVLIWTKEAFSR